MKLGYTSHDVSKYWPDQSILYVADSGEKKIKNLKYAPEMLTIINSEIGLEDVMYS